MEGIWEWYNELGGMSIRGSFSGSEKNGIWEYYTENGEIEMKCLYENGVPIKELWEV
jgi:antitoxin component YwqK of YwqJK toxin-antitoxin module